MAHCKRADCVFNDRCGLCIIPENKNFYVEKDGAVFSCLNYICKESELSPDGRQRLKEYSR